MDRPAGIDSRMSGDERRVGMLIHNFCLVRFQSMRILMHWPAIETGEIAYRRYNPVLDTCMEYEDVRKISTLSQDIVEQLEAKQ